jgi:hypothetical protein
VKPLHAATKKKILGYLKRGVPRKYAAQGSGISYDAFNAYLLAGVQPGASATLADFARQVYQLETDKIADKFDLLEELAAEDPKAIEVFFKLRFPKLNEDDTVDAIDAKPAKKLTFAQALRAPGPEMLAALREAAPFLLPLLTQKGLSKQDGDPAGDRAGADGPVGADGAVRPRGPGKADAGE